jgi:hypothetical protein
MSGIKLSIGFVDNVREKLGFSLMKFGLTINKPILKQNIYYMLLSSISDAEFTQIENIQIKEENYDVVINKINEKNITPWLWDSKIKYVNIDTWKKIIRNDFTNRIKYFADYFDCDNYAVLFSSMINIFYGLNSAGVALGKVFDKNGNLMGYHAYNILYADDNVYCYEPQDDTIKVADKKTDMDWAIYETDILIYL